MVYVRYLLNWWMDFDQTCLYTVLGKGKVLSRFGWLWPNFQGHTCTLKCLKYGYRALSSEPVNWFWRIDTLLGKGRELIRFWRPWLNFQVWNVQNRGSVPYLLNKWMEFNQTYLDILMGVGEKMVRFWWPWPNIQGHTGTLKCPK